MARVELKEPCYLDGKRHEKGEIVDVPDLIAEANARFMVITDKEIASASSKTPAKADK